MAPVAILDKRVSAATLDMQGLVNVHNGPPAADCSCTKMSFVLSFELHLSLRFASDLSHAQNDQCLHAQLGEEQQEVKNVET